MRSARFQLFGRYLVAFLGVIALTFSAAATASANTTVKHVTLVHDVLVGETMLPAGDYLLVIDGGKMLVEQGKRVVAQAAARWEERDEMPVYDSVLYADGYHVIEIRFKHQRDVLVVVAPPVRSASLPSRSDTQTPQP
ncbi:MAG: hypothetical protein WBF06_06455 [Candidatus Acidiferrales bacterium]